jgi:SAM-dependent methyltransferase
MQLVEKKSSAKRWLRSDEEFNCLYPDHIQLLARRHWTPLEIIRKAAGFLGSERNARVLDIGSGVGKFCLGAAITQPKAFYYGIEQRKSLVTHAEDARKTLGLHNVSFVHGNFTQLDLRNYDHFYFYNSFYENLSGTSKIDDSISYSGELFNYYNHYLFKQLNRMPAGTRLVTFHSMEDEVPPGYHVVACESGSLLKFWIKI